MSNVLNFRDKKLPELRNICRAEPQKYYGFSKFNKQDLINFMYQKNSTQPIRYRTIPSYDISDVSHIFETQDERDDRISELEEMISDLSEERSEERPEDSIVRDIVSDLRKEYPNCDITFDPHNDEYNDMIYKGNKGKYIKQYGDLGKGGEMILYHGTDKKNLLSILNDDFRLTSNPVNGHMFGKGIYFTNDIDKAIYYSERSKSTKYIIVCNVHIGDICLGNSSMDVHPKMPSYLGDKCYDTSVDNIHSPKQFVKKKNGTYNILGILKIKNYNNLQNNQFTGSFQIVNNMKFRIKLYWVPDNIVYRLPNVDLNKCKRMSDIPRKENGRPGTTGMRCQIGHTFICVSHFPTDSDIKSPGPAIIKIFKSTRKNEIINISF